MTDKQPPPTPAEIRTQEAIQRTQQEFTTLRPTSRATRYVYHVHGHAKLHHFSDNPDPDPSSLAVPFEMVLREPTPITSDGDMGDVRARAREHVVGELKRADSPYIVGDVMLRGVNLLHTILVDEDDPEGPAVRVLS